jgi:hypothetical protein
MIANTRSATSVRVIDSKGGRYPVGNNPEAVSSGPDMMAMVKTKRKCYVSKNSMNERLKYMTLMFEPFDDKSWTMIIEFFKSALSSSTHPGLHGRAGRA